MRVAYCAPRGLALSVFLSWSDADQDAALSWQAQEARRCRQCGTDPEDWSGDPDAYHAESMVCRGCARLENLRKKVEEGALSGTVLRLAAGPAGCPTCPPKK